MSDDPPQLHLYATFPCRLCELAWVEIARVIPPDSGIVLEVDIAVDDRLVAQYGERIPVLRRCVDGAELDWPFDSDAVLALRQAGTPRFL